MLLRIFFQTHIRFSLILIKIIQERDWKDYTEKGICPYEYLTSIEKLEEKMLPAIEHFVSSLTGKSVSR